MADSLLAPKVEDLARACTSEDDLFTKVVEAISVAQDHYNWVGIYRVEGDDLVLTAWRGPQATQHTRIPLSQGVCGFAATEGQTVVVDDVNADPRYLACFPSTKAEIVVPIVAGGRVVAEIDIDSDTAGSFNDDDKESLEAVAAAVGRRVAELRG